MNPLTCHEARPLLSGHADRDLDTATADAVGAHVEGCAGCAGVLADLRRIRGAARDLDAMEPPDHVWRKVASQIRPGTLVPGARGRASGRRDAWWQWLGLSAALLAITTVAYLLRGPSVTVLPPNLPAGNQQTESAEPARGGVTEPSAVTDVLKAAADYEREIAALQGVAGAGSVALEPTEAATLAAEGDAIDRAIAESRAAVVESPDNEPARVSLFEALRRKLSMLQATVSLINEMNQGDPAGAARAAEGLGRQS